MSKARKIVATIFATLALAVAVAPIASASPSPPTNGGNGGGPQRPVHGEPAGSAGCLLGNVMEGERALS
jgi:hypothetical protein